MIRKCLVLLLSLKLYISQMKFPAATTAPKSACYLEKGA